MKEVNIGGDNLNNVKAMFNNEIRDKKRTARGIHNRASRRGIRGGVRTPVDYLTGDDKKKYMGNGKVVSYYMVDNWEDFINLAKENQVSTFIHLLKTLGKTKGVADSLNVAPSTLYSWINRNNLYSHPDISHYFKRTKKQLLSDEVNKSDTSKNTSETVSKDFVSSLPINNTGNTSVVENVTKVTPKNKLNYTIDGTMTSDMVSTCLTSLELMLVKDKTYKVSITISEV